MRPPDLALPYELRSARGRTTRGLHVLEGVPAFLHACDRGVEFAAIYHSRILLRSPTAQKLVRHRRRDGVPTRHLTPEAYRRLSHTGRAAGILAVARTRWSALDDIPTGPTPCLLVLEAIRSPGNLGTILRTAEAAGLPGVVLLDPAADAHHPAAIRASMGTVYDVPLVRSDHGTFSLWARRHALPIVGSRPRVERAHTVLSALGPFALVVGEERAGLTRHAEAICDFHVAIPLRGQADSLNVAVAAGIMVYAALGDGRPAPVP